MPKNIESGYAFSRAWFDFAFENHGMISTNDTALFMYLIELNNRLGWVKQFGITSNQCMTACGFNTYKPYKRSLDKLIEIGFVKLVKKSANQYQCNIIALSLNAKATDKAMDKAIAKAKAKQPPKQRQYSLNPKTLKPLKKEGRKNPSPIIFLKPTIEQVKQYFLENGYNPEIGVKAFQIYNEGDWKDTRGNKIENWKQKMISVWFKQEHKIQPEKKRGVVY